jgi:exosortase A
MWNLTRTESLAPPEGGGLAESSGPTAARPAPPAKLAGNTRLGVAIAVALSLLWLLFWYRDTALAMEAIWNRSGTFAHGYLVAPISLWLVWRKRGQLATLPLRYSMVGLLAGLAWGFAWLMGELASVDAVSQFALVGMLICVVWAVAGTAVARALAFPLGFLFFSVPFGEFLFPTMMDFTAEFVVRAVRLSGVPVYVEGRSLVIPSGHWQIVEGCSGVRYLIASVVVGSLYAYLNYRSLSRRLVFTALAVVVPILANWLRAYGIVMLGHVSDNRLATGVDHLVYGWVFFGIVMLGLFWIGARWQEEPVPVNRRVDESLAIRTGAGSRVLVWGLAALAVFSLWQPLLGWLQNRGEHGTVQLATPAPAAGWAMAGSGQFPEWSPRYSGMRAVGHSTWEKDGSRVGLYLGFYRDQGPGLELINSENRVLMNKDQEWSYRGRHGQEAVLGKGAVAVQATEIQGAVGRLLVWHWYWIGGMVTSNEFAAKGMLALRQLAGRGDDSAVVMIYGLEGDEGPASVEGALDAFTRDMGAEVHRALKVTAER